MLRVEGLETAYGVSQVLFGVSLSIEEGQVATLLGRNGMGKTTTVLSVMGVVPSRAGSIEFQGKALRGLPSYRVAQAGLGLVPEGRQVFPNLTVRETLVATAANRGGAAKPWGREMSPIAITVAPTIPVVAANKPPTKTTETPKPPRILPNK